MRAVEARSFLRTALRPILPIIMQGRENGGRESRTEGEDGGGERERQKG